MNRLERSDRQRLAKLTTRGLVGVLLATNIVWAAGKPPTLRVFWSKVMGMYCAAAASYPDLAKDLGGDRAFLVVAVAKGSAAEEAHVVRGDVILSRPSTLQPGKIAEFYIRRRGRKYKVRLHTRQHDQPKQFSAAFVGEKSNTLVVDPTGHGTCRTIARALSLAGPDSTVLVSDGVYRETLIMPGRVKLQARPGHTPYLECALGIYGVNDVQVRGFILQSLPDIIPLQMLNASHVHVANLEVRQVATEPSKQSVGIESYTCEDVVIEGCRIAGRLGLTGIRMHQTTAQLKNNVVSNCERAIWLSDCPRADVAHNLLLSNKHGLLVHRSSNVTAERNVVKGTTKGIGVELIKSQITFRHNAIRRNLHGVAVTDSRGKLTDNTFSQNRWAVNFFSGEAEFAANAVLDNYYGLAVFAKSNTVDVVRRITAHHNNFGHNELTAIGMGNGADVRIRSNLIEDSQFGVYVGDATCKMTNNTIAMQSVAGVEIEGTSRVRMQNNIVAFNTRGIRIQTESSLTSEFNCVFGNLATKSLPLSDGNYVRVDWLPLTTGERLRVEIFPAYDLAGKTDMHVDPKFVKFGRDYRLARNSPLSGKTGALGAGIGALGVAEDVASEDGVKHTTNQESQNHHGNGESKQSSPQRPSAALKESGSVQVRALNKEKGNE